VEKISLIVKEFGILLVIALVGVGVLAYGLWGELGSEKATVEIVKDQNKEQVNIEYREGRVTVDVAGAVEKPGVYQLSSGSRLGDALVMSGGLSSSADREWVAKTINLAQEVKDGEKIYIPAKGNGVGTENKNIEYRDSHGKVNINTASLSELDGLEGIGEVRAKTILDNRPYSQIDDLVSKAKIPESVYEKIKDIVTVY
jgi:competence protein ComEA